MIIRLRTRDLILTEVNYIFNNKWYCIKLGICVHNSQKTANTP